MKKIFVSQKSKLEVVKKDSDNVVIFIQNDTYYPSKICSIILDSNDIKELITTLNSQIQQ
jgi:hypothetical protein